MRLKGRCTSVSYTHLDVYKRQMLNKDGLIAGLEERLDRLKKEDDAHEKQSAA